MSKTKFIQEISLEEINHINPYTNYSESVNQPKFDCKASLLTVSSFGNIVLANSSLVILVASCQDNLMLSTAALTFRTVL